MQTAAGDHEVLSYGSDEPPRRPPPLLLGVAAACLGLGFVAGLLVGTGWSPGEPDKAETPSTVAGSQGPIPVAAGAVTKYTPPHDDRFGLSLFNWGKDPITAEVVALPGWVPDLTGRSATRIAPRSWALLRFSAPVDDCGIRPRQALVVVVWVETQEGADSHIVPLAEPADDVLREHHDAVCAAREPSP